MVIFSLNFVHELELYYNSIYNKCMQLNFLTLGKCIVRRSSKLWMKPLHASLKL